MPNQDAAQAISFWSLAAVTVVASLLVVSVRNLFHAVLYLVVSFIGVAGIYLTLNAPVLAAIQVLVYAGAIAVLTLFAIMLTRDAMTRGNVPGPFQAPALATALLIMGLLAYVFGQTRWPAAPEAPPAFTLERLADALFVVYTVPFELASVVLLVAMVGAIVLAKE